VAVEAITGTIHHFIIFGKSVRFFVENDHDEIQRYHVAGSFYELEELSIISSHLPAESVFVDIGANVGNHVLYLSLFGTCSRIIPFEANPRACAILKSNIALNNVTNVDLSFLGIGISDSDGRLVMKESDEFNLGGTSFINSPKGSIRCIPGDAVLMDIPVSFMKIDLEGMEILAISGLHRTILRWNPFIFIEVIDSNFELLDSQMREFGYCMVEQFSRYAGITNFLYVPTEKKEIALQNIQNRLTKKSVYDHDTQIVNFALQQATQRFIASELKAQGYLDEIKKRQIARPLRALGKFILPPYIRKPLGRYLRALNRLLNVITARRSTAADEPANPGQPDRNTQWSGPDVSQEFIAKRPTGKANPSLCLPKTVLRAFIIDSRWPRTDRDSGSIDAIMLVRALKKLGFEVLFAADSEFSLRNAYRDYLEAEGVQCIGSECSNSIADFIASDGKSIDLSILTRVGCGGRYLELIKQFAPQARIIFNTVDLHHVRELRESAGRKDANGMLKSYLTREREFYVARQSDATIVVSAVEKSLLDHEIPGSAVYEMPLSRPLHDSFPGFSERTGVGFIGGFDHTPNVDAVNFLLEAIWPMVIRKIPSMRLSIVGYGLPNKIIQTLPDSVHYLGQVPDINPWLDSLKLTIAPLRYGAGAKGKVATSLAAGVPCVGTTVAAEGMQLQDGVHMAISNTPEQIANLICEVYENRTMWENLSSGGYLKAKEDFSIESGERRLENLIRHLAIRES
jgi:FkbM family methyltransferase